MTTVLLTTSGLGTRLAGLTQYTNKALVPIGEKYAICRIIERFPNDTHFVITLGYYGNHVRQFLELAYPSRQFTFVPVTPYEGPGSSQAYSMLCAAHHLQKPFLYHCCDTILPAEYHLPPPDPAAAVTLYVSPHADYTTYSGITVADGIAERKVQRFNAKREAIHDYAYIGIAHIQDPQLFWGELERESYGAQVAESVGDTDAYRRILQVRDIQYHVVPTFYDTGNLESYRHACAAFPSSAIVLAKPNESLCFLKEQGRVIKFLHSASTNAKRVRRGQMLEGAPRILGATANFLAMSYEEGDVLANCREWGEVRRLLDWTYARLWSTQAESADFQVVCHRFYHSKTMQRLLEYKAKRPEDLTIVNGQIVGSMDDVLRRVPWAQLNTSRFTHYHGDFILDNILRRPNHSFVLLDWRDSFDTELEWGDPAYDLAKLRHNLVFQHANIARGEFTIQREGGQVFVDLSCKYLLIRQLEELDAWIVEKGWDLMKIRILQALIWLNMAPLYETPLCDFLYYFGKWNLSLTLSAATSAAP